jgi:hypothetical protein
VKLRQEKPLKMEKMDRIDSKLLNTFEIIEKLGEGGSGVSPLPYSLSSF